MFKHILIAVDRRDCRDAVRLAHDLADPHARLTLVNVNVLHPVYAKGSLGGEFSIIDELRQRSLALLDDACVDSGVSERTSVTATSVGRGLHEVAESEGADLLVLASSHRGLIDRVMLGDATAEAIEGSPCAVAIAPSAYSQSARPMHEVGVAYNETPEAEHALDVARAISSGWQAHLSAFEAVALPMYVYAGLGIAYNEIAEDTLKSVRERLGRLGGVDARVAFGDPAEELTTYSDSLDLLVVGSRDFGALGRIVHSSVTRRLVHSAHCPLLILTRAVREHAAGPEALTASGIAAA